MLKLCLNILRLVTSVKLQIVIPNQMNFHSNVLSKFQEFFVTFLKSHSHMVQANLYVACTLCRIPSALSSYMHLTTSYHNVKK